MAETTALTPQQSFQKKLEDRIRENIGELMPDEALQEIVAKAVQKAFFDPVIKTDRYGHTNSSQEPPWMVTLTREILEKQTGEAVRKWFADNPEKVEKLIEEYFATSVSKTVIRSINHVFQQDLFNMEQRLQSTLNELRDAG